VNPFDAAAVVGLAMIATGLALIYVPAALIGVGLLVVLLAVTPSRRGLRRNR